ncbi:hypothetical protein N8H74_11890 [Pseudomonas sp. B2M1-30]|uniref:hypothetical protein n=1 Tax=Pseudomonas TaxID=286 RepID=UPI0021C9D028|nr:MULTISPECIES: hypothetical protein [Pseudomonas]MCU0118956.1 hypothetical protein [Pseudomonas sp. B2M1-30]MCU7263915.1 hypothetical protein [Pseudomonas koreensis]
MVIHPATALVLAVVACNSIAASFDCTKASNFAEKEICRDGYLSGLDTSLAQNYKAALLKAPDRQDAIIQSQREWLITRNQCTTQKCLDIAMEDRFKAIEDFTRAEVERKLELEQQQQVAKSQAEDADRARRKHEAYVAEEQAYQQRRKAAQQQAAYSQANAVSTPSTYQTSAYQTAPQQQRQFAETHEETLWQKIFGILWKFSLIVAIIISCWAVKKHRNKEVTIYNNYTDATITNLLPVTGWVFGLFCGWLGLPHQVYQVCVVTGLLLAVFFAVYTAIKSNRGSLNILLSIVAKLTFASLFYVIMMILILSFFGGARRKGESLTQAEARQRRESRNARIKIVAVSAGYTLFTAWLCRRSEFTPLSECLEFDPPYSA